LIYIDDDQYNLRVGKLKQTSYVSNLVVREMDISHGIVTNACIPQIDFLDLSTFTCMLHLVTDQHWQPEDLT